ncbi:MAG TPA: LodA/GoxA family CTQ-dependent oxidase [Luteibacter sp.]|uniref:LodA/GoxA family CTQ-dependent oxidase n=1 Tax=Luteibacter sp. TaxID=1886636 RepID=UPI002CC07718|nr:LodA/GoxA family CTQ-dependent oxidase [Luteibacter sp.]HVI53529.1 LodA/GoxA family CTQ-dependent oxidase [Luteibacter sp.]
MTDRKKQIKTGKSVAVPPSPESGSMRTAIEAIRRLFVDKVQHDHIVNEKQTPAKRAAFIKQHGSAHAVFQVSDDLDERYQVGIFQPGAHYEAWMRFSSDIPDERPDKNSTVGVGIKLFGVPGEKALEEDIHVDTLDFVLQNTEVFFAADAMEMAEFKTAAVNGTLPQWLAEHPETDAILTAMEKPVDSVLTERLWSCIPYKFGPDDYCKYILSVQSAADPTTPPDMDEPNYLARDLQERLLNGGAKLDFYVQLRTDAKESLINARSIWDEKIAVPVKVATLIIPQQDIGARGQAEYGEALSYNIWRTLTDLAPVGSIAEARKVVYRSSSQTRRNVNGQPIGEPIEPRPPGAPIPPYESTFEEPWPPSKADEDAVAYAVIHPGIGVARVGNSPTEYYVGPEYASAPPPPFGSTRDGTGAIKRQAARFRIYGYNSAGVAIKELTPDNADIEWKVEIANKKAEWFAFDTAMDIPEAKPVARRNPLITGAARAKLAIRPSAKTIRGKHASAVQFDDGTFKDKPVNLGELRTDDLGRLLVLGGHGVSASPSGAPLVTFVDGVEQNFNNSVDWYDDTADGPVSATVHVAGNPIPVTGAWVVVAPPDYAPGIVAFRSMYDMARHAAIDGGIIPADDATSYSTDILPLLQRLSDLQWVNLGFAEVFGMGGSTPISTSLIRELPAPESNDQRIDIYAQFRSPDDESPPVGSALKWPQLYGDGLGQAAPSSPGDVLPVAPRTYAHLANFAQSNFVNDLDLTQYPEIPHFAEPRYAKPIEESPIADQPSRLDEGPLSYCIADAFHPGCELTWPMRHATLYDALVRIKHRPDSAQEPDYGVTLTPEQALANDGPLQAQGPGDLTRWMALPWQGDTARCRSGYDPEFHPYLPSFWPAKVPNDVLTEANYLTYLNTSLSDGARKGAFAQRDKWLRAFLLENQDNEAVMQAMVSRFDEMGIVQLRPAPADYSTDIASVYVEQLKPGAPRLPRAAAAFGGRIDGVPIAERGDLLKEAGWTESAWDAFRRKR